MAYYDSRAGGRRFPVEHWCVNSEVLPPTTHPHARSSQKRQTGVVDDIDAGIVVGTLTVCTH